MKIYYDVTNPDAAYEWVYSILDIKQGGLIEDYVLQCSSDFEKFFEEHIDKIKEIDINKLELVAIHVTSNNDNCLAIRNQGLKNLKVVLSEDTELSRFLLGEQIAFDINQKKMFIQGSEYEIDYQKYLRMGEKTKQQEELESIARKIYYDYQVNGFFFNKDIFDYGTGIHKHPEFLLTLSALGKEVHSVVDKWDECNEGYVIKYKSQIKDFEYYTFYYSIDEYLKDSKNGWIQLKKLLLSRAIDSCFSNLESEIFAYMKPGIIEPERIIECIPIGEWKEHVAKYFE